jgi:TatD DNase family protein
MKAKCERPPNQSQSNESMVETDAPYFAPAPNRTKRCEPAFLRETAAFIANLRSMSLAAFAAQSTQNAQGFFGLNTLEF